LVLFDFCSATESAATAALWSADEELHHTAPLSSRAIGIASSASAHSLQLPHSKAAATNAPPSGLVSTRRLHLSIPALSSSSSSASASAASSAPASAGLAPAADQTGIRHGGQMHAVNSD
jgi:hypothetical protein